MSRQGWSMAKPPAANNTVARASDQRTRLGDQTPQSAALPLAALVAVTYELSVMPAMSCQVSVQRSKAKRCTAERACHARQSRSM